MPGLAPWLRAVQPPPAAPTTRPGEVVERDDGGNLRARYRTDNKGVRNGAYEEFHPDGKPRVRGTYTAGQKSGAWTTLDELGKPVETANYRKGALEGPFAANVAGSKAGYKATYRQGQLAGPVTVLDDKGRVVHTVKYPRPLAEVRGAWDKLYPKEVKPPKYTADPVLEPPYKAGTIAPESLEEALKVVKLYRYLSGVPFQNLSLDPSANEKAQHGAVLLTKIGSLTHTPSKPGDMDEAFFKLGHAGCNQSNLHQGQDSLISGIRGFMDDSDEGNVKVLGHRQWVLKPGLAKTGFGSAKGFTAMHVVDGSRDVPNFDYIAFPGEGFYPLQLVEKHYAWSVHFHAAKVQVPAAEAMKITVTRLDGHYQPGKQSEAGIVSVVAAADKGWNMIVFRPKIEAVEAGRFWVEITGLKVGRGAAPPLGYIVELLDMTPPPAATEAGAPGGTGER